MLFFSFVAGCPRYIPTVNKPRRVCAETEPVGTLGHPLHDDFGMNYKNIIICGLAPLRESVPRNDLYFYLILQNFRYDEKAFAIYPFNLHRTRLCF